jgi:hypothetical protein
MKQALKFCGDIGDLDGPYPYVNETQIVSDSRKVLTALRQAIAEAEQPDLARVGEVGVWGDKREWVGLTDEEIYDYADKFLYTHGSNYGIKSFGKAIEAKLKEKNNG